MKKELITDKECAALYGCGVSTWWRWVKEKKTPAPVRIGGVTRWRISELESHLEVLSLSKPTQN